MRFELLGRRGIARLVGVAAIVGAITAVAFVGSGTAGSQAKYVIGVSNTLVGNGWREEMICAVKAQAQGERRGQQGDHREPQRRPGGADRGHPQPDLGGCERDHHQPVERHGAQRGDRPGRGARNQGRLGRSARDGAAGAQRHERPGRLRTARRRVAVQEARVARATSSRCAASPASRPTPTGIRASSRRSRSTRASRSSSRPS